MAEGRRMMRLAAQLRADDFEAVLGEYQGLLRCVFEERGGRDVELSSDTASAAFPTARQAALAAVAVQRAVAAHRWPHGLTLAVSVALDSGEAALERCSELCDAAEGGQIFLSQATAGLLDDEDLGELRLRDIGDVETRRTARSVRAYELVVPEASEISERRPRS